MSTNAALSGVPERGMAAVRDYPPHEPQRRSKTGLVGMTLAAVVPGGTHSPTGEAAATHVRVVPVVKPTAIAGHPVDIPGRLLPSGTTEMVSAHRGSPARLRVHTGEFVRKGDVLFSYRPDEAAIAVAAATSRVAALRTRAASSRPPAPSDLKTAERALGRAERALAATVVRVPADGRVAMVVIQHPSPRQDDAERLSLSLMAEGPMRFAPDPGFWVDRSARRAAAAGR